MKRLKGQGKRCPGAGGRVKRLRIIALKQKRAFTRRWNSRKKDTRENRRKGQPEGGDHHKPEMDKTNIGCTPGVWGGGGGG